MRVVCMSDTHLRHKVFPIQVPEADILIHSGDALAYGHGSELKDFSKWFSALQHRIKVFVAGNHDVVFEKEPERARALLPPGVIYLQDSMAELEGLKIYGSPWQPEFCDWAFNLPRGHRLREKWNLIPQGIDILVTHGPPLGILDQNYQGEHVGCGDLRDVVLRVRPRLHIFGHIHGSHGTARIGDTLFVNAAICDERYRPNFDPVVVEIPKEGPATVVSDGIIGEKRDTSPAVPGSAPPLW